MGISTLRLLIWKMRIITYRSVKNTDINQGSISHSGFICTTGAACTFTKIINNVLLGLRESTCLILMDDILISHVSSSSMLKAFDRSREDSFPLNVTKCNFAQGHVEYLVHNIEVGYETQ